MQRKKRSKMLAKKEMAKEPRNGIKSGKGEGEGVAAN